MAKYLFEYAHRAGFLQKLDPLTKLMGALAIYIILFTFQEPLPVFAVLGFLILLLYFGAKISPVEYWPLLALFVPFFVLLSLLQAFIFRPPGGGHLLFQSGNVRATVEGLIRGVTFSTRFATAAISFLVFSMTTTPAQIEMMLTRHGMPYKAAYLLSFALRYFDVFQEELVDLRNAAAVRGERLEMRNPLHGGRLVYLVTAPLLVSVFRRSLDIALAMQLRGWERSNQRTLLRSLPLKRVDYALTFAAVALLIGFFATRFYFK